MRNTATKDNTTGVLLVIILLTLVPSIGVAQTLMFKLSGYNYPDGAWEVGSTVTVAGRLTPPIDGPSGFQYPIPMDFDNHEYTFVISGMEISSFSETDWGSFVQAHTKFLNGELRIYEDSPGSSSFGVTPPNATTPSSFENGALLLTASVEDAVSFVFGASGTFNATVLFAGQGSLWEEWSAVIALAGSPVGTAPLGFVHDFSGVIQPNFPAVPVRSLNWDGVKGIFR